MIAPASSVRMLGVYHQVLGLLTSLVLFHAQLELLKDAPGACFCMMCSCAEITRKTHFYRRSSLQRGCNYLKTQITFYHVYLFIRIFE